MIKRINSFYVAPTKTKQEVCNHMTTDKTKKLTGNLMAGLKLLGLEIQ